MVERLPPLPPAAQAWVVPFRPTASSDDVLAFKDPFPAYASAQAIPAATIHQSPSTLHAIDDLTVLALPAGSLTPIEWQRAAEDWMRQSVRAQDEPAIETVLRSDRLFWRPGRALIIGDPERFRECLLGLADFSFHEGQLRRLERMVDADWLHVERDLVFTHRVSRVQLRVWPEIGRLTERYVAARMTIARLERPLEKPSMSLPPSARRVVAELISATEILDRYKSADDRIEVYEDLYSTINDRMSEYYHYSREYLLELLVLIALMIEIVVTAMEIFRP